MPVGLGLLLDLFAEELSDLILLSVGQELLLGLRGLVGLLALGLLVGGDLLGGTLDHLGRAVGVGDCLLHRINYAAAGI